MWQHKGLVSVQLRCCYCSSIGDRFGWFDCMQHRSSVRVVRVRQHRSLVRVVRAQQHRSSFRVVRVQQHRSSFRVWFECSSIEVRFGCGSSAAASKFVSGGSSAAASKFGSGGSSAAASEFVSGGSSAAASEFVSGGSSAAASEFDSGEANSDRNSFHIQLRRHSIRVSLRFVKCQQSSQSSVRICMAISDPLAGFLWDPKCPSSPGKS